MQSCVRLFVRVSVGVCVQVCSKLYLIESFKRQFPSISLDAPYIMIFPKNVTVMEYEPAELSCKAVGKPPLSSYIWKQDGRLKSTETSERIYFPSARRTDGGRYSCAGINTVGAGRPAFANLIVMCKTVFIQFNSSFHTFIKRVRCSKVNEQVGGFVYHFVFPLTIAEIAF